MMLIVWLAVGLAALLLLAVLGYGLLGHLNRLRKAVGDAQTAVEPQLEELSVGIRKARSLRMQEAERDTADPTRGHERHA